VEVRMVMFQTTN